MEKRSAVMTHPSTSSESEKQQPTLIEHQALRYGGKQIGEEMLTSAGYSIESNLLRERAKELGLKHYMINFIETLHSFQWGGQLPFPSVKLLAERMQVSERRIRQYLKLLREKKFLTVHERTGTTSYYDFTPLFSLLVRMERKRKKALAQQDLWVMKFSSGEGGNLFQPNNTNGKEHIYSGYYSNDTSSISLIDSFAGLTPEGISFFADLSDPLIDQQGEEEQEQAATILFPPPAGETAPTPLACFQSPKQESSVIVSKEAQEAGQQYIERVLEQQYNRRNRPAPRPAITNVVEYIAEDLNDQDLLAKHKGKSTRTQILRLAEQSGMDDDAFIDLMNVVHKRVRGKAAETIKSKGKDGKPNRMPLFFHLMKKVIEQGLSVLEEKKQEEQAQGEESQQPVQEETTSIFPLQVEDQPVSEEENPEVPVIIEAEQRQCRRYQPEWLQEKIRKEEKREAVLQVLSEFPRVTYQKKPDDAPLAPFYQEPVREEPYQFPFIATIEQAEQPREDPFYVYAYYVVDKLQERREIPVVAAHTAHTCGCPIFFKIGTKPRYRWRCAFCEGEQNWSEETHQLILSARDYIPGKE